MFKFLAVCSFNKIRGNVFLNEMTIMVKERAQTSSMDFVPFATIHLVSAACKPSFLIHESFSNTSLVDT